MATWYNASLPSKADGMALFATLSKTDTLRASLAPAKSGNGWMLSWVPSDKPVFFVSDAPWDGEKKSPEPAPVTDAQQDEEPC